MNKTLMSDAGENYEYIKVLIENRIKLVKLDLAESAAKLIGKTLLFLCVLTICMMVVMGLLVTLAIYLGVLLGSFTVGILIVCALLLFIGFLAYLWRRKLFYLPASHLVVQLLEESEKENEGI